MVHTHVPRLHGSCSSKQYFAYYGSLATILIAGYDHFSHTCQHHLFIAINKGEFFLHRIAIESANKIIWTCVATQCRNGNFSFLVMQYAFKWLQLQLTWCQQKYCEPIKILQLHTQTPPTMQAAASLLPPHRCTGWSLWIAICRGSPEVSHINNHHYSLRKGLWLVFKYK